MVMTTISGVSEGIWTLDGLLDQVIHSWEYQIAKDGSNLSLWIDYFHAANSYQLQVFVIERAVRELPRSYKLWMMYLELVLGRVEGNGAISDEDYGVLDRLFTRCLKYCNKFPMIWYKYLEFRLRYRTENVLKEFGTCFANLPLTQHHIIWPLYLKYADLTKNDTIIMNYITFNGEYTIDELLKLIDFGNCSQAYELFLNQTFPLEHWKSIIEAFISHKFPVDNVIYKAIRRFPDQLALFYLMLAGQYNHDVEKVRYLFNQAIKLCLTVGDFSILYEHYTKYEEAYLDKLGDSNSELELELNLSHYESLIENRPVLLNDMLLRQDDTNLDNWFQRLEIFKLDLNKLLGTYVKAITSINPLKCHSLQGHSLSELWINYSKVYSQQKDFKTAELIFQKSLTSKFKSMDDLLNIYKNWCQLYLEQEDIEGGIKLIESVIFQDKSIDLRDKTLELSDRIIKSTQLWDYYLEILEIYVDDINKIILSYNKMIDLKIAKPINIINFANFLEQESAYEEMFKLLEKSLISFKDDRIKFEIYNIYLTKLLKHNSDDKERIRDLFDKSLNDVNDNHVSPIIILYSEFEFNNGLVIKAVNLLRKYINKVSNPIDLINNLMDKLEKINDMDQLRELMQSINTISLSNTHLITIMKRFIDLETIHHQYDRVRSLFQYTITNTNNPELWHQWEQFELNHGNENTFKTMLRFKRQFKPPDINNPMGFIKSDSSTKNPESIDIDM